MDVKKRTGSRSVAIGLPLRDQSNARGGQGKENSLLRSNLRVTPRKKEDGNQEEG